MSNIDPKLEAIIAESKPMSKREYQAKLGEIDLQIDILDVQRMVLEKSDVGTNDPQLTRINHSLDELYQLRNRFIEKFAMSAYEDSPSLFGWLTRFITRLEN